MKSFTIKEAFSFAWASFKKHAKFILPLFIVLGVLYMLVGYGSQDRSWNGAVIQFVGTIIEIYLSLGIINIFIRLYDGKDARVKDLFVSWNMFGKGLWGAILVLLIVLGGTILFIVPGIVWWITYVFYSYFIVEKKVSAMESLRLSRKATTGERWHLLGFMVVTIVINLIGFAIFGIGALVSVPLTMFATTYVYKKLSHKVENTEQKSAEVSV